MKHIQKILLPWLLLFALLFVLVTISDVDAATWVEPSGCDPASDPENCAVEPPINVSADNQTKTGGLTIDGNLIGNSLIKTPDLADISESSFIVMSSSAIDIEPDTYLTITSTNFSIDQNGYITNIPGALTDNTVNTDDIVDDTVSATDLAETLDFAATDLLNLSNVRFNAVGGDKGLVVPHGAAPTQDAVQTGTIYYNALDNTIMMWDANLGAWQTVQAPPSTDDWVDEVGDSMSGKLDITMAAGNTDDAIVIDVDGTGKGLVVDTVSDNAIEAVANVGYGVYGSSTTSPGVRGNSVNNIGVYGTSDTTFGVQGSSTDSVGIRGVSTNSYGASGVSTNNHGMYGTTSSTDKAGVYGNSTNGPGTVGYSTNEIGVYGNVASTGEAGVQGCHDEESCGYLGYESVNSGIVYGGYFEDSAVVEKDMSANKFLPTGEQLSLNPYIQQAIMSREVIHESYYNYRVQIYNMMYDGTYLWAGIVTRPLVVTGPPADQFYLLKMRGSDMGVVHTYIGAINMSGGGQIVDLGRNIAIGNNSTVDCTVWFLNKNNPVDNHYQYSPSTPAEGDCRGLVYDGSRLWMTDALIEKIHYINFDQDLSAVTDGELDSVITANCVDPRDIVFDGENIWAVCHDALQTGNGTVNGEILKFHKSCYMGASHPSCSYKLYDARGRKPNKLLYDNTHFWVSYDELLSTTDLRKLELNEDTDHLDIVQEFNIGFGIQDMEFDGTNIWAVRPAQDQVAIIPAHGEVSSYETRTKDAPEYLEFDGSFMWQSSSYDNGRGYELNKWSTSNGTQGVSHPQHYQGIILTAEDNTLLCAVIDTSGPSPAWNYYSAASDPSYFRLYCGEGIN